METTIEETMKEINKDQIVYFYKNEPLINSPNNPLAAK